MVEKYKSQFKTTSYVSLPLSVGLSANGLFLYSGGSGGVKNALPGGAYEGTAPTPASNEAPWWAGGLEINIVS